MIPTYLILAEKNKSAEESFNELNPLILMG